MHYLDRECSCEFNLRDCVLLVFTYLSTIITTSSTKEKKSIVSQQYSLLPLPGIITKVQFHKFTDVMPEVSLASDF